MSDWLFAWIFVIVLYCILPDVVLTKMETVTAICFFFHTGLYLWYLIMDAFKSHKKMERKQNKKMKGG